MYEYILGVGAMKAGTTLLYDLLRKHPSIRHGHLKELHYFDHTDNPDKAEYDRLFGAGEGIKLDITPIYMYDFSCIDKICHTLDPKKVAVVVLLRDPIERALSHYKMCLSQAQEDKPFEVCFDLEPQRIASSAHDKKTYSYFTRGLYAAQLDYLYRFFPKENILIFVFEDFIRHQQACIDQICDFAGLSHIQIRDTLSNKTVVDVKSQALARLMRWMARLTPNRLKFNWMRRLKYRIACVNERKGYKNQIDPAFERRLVTFYRTDVDALKKKYGLDTTPWRHFTHTFYPTPQAITAKAAMVTRVSRQSVEET